MKFKTFIAGLLASFGLPWLLTIVLPFIWTRNITPPAFDADADGKTGLFQAKRSGRIANGELVYAANGCYICHTQVIRPTYAGNDIWREGWGGKERGTYRESVPSDYEGEKVARIGLSRTGPDLANFGYRAQAYAAKAGEAPEAWVLKHLYNPAGKPGAAWSNCPAQKHLFTLKGVRGTGNARSLNAQPDDHRGYSKGKRGAILPTSEAEALASYLLSMKKDHPLPYALNPDPGKKRADGK